MNRSVLALAQLDFTVGDIEGNLNKIIDSASMAYSEGAKILVMPELALSGYPAEDLLIRSDFLRDVENALKRLIDFSLSWKGMLLLIGHPSCHSSQFRKENKIDILPDSYSCGKEAIKIFNTVSLIADGKLWSCYDKRILPNYGVFDEKRYFSPGREKLLFEWVGIKYGVLICEDIWNYDCSRDAADGAQVLIIINASPFCSGKFEERMSLLSNRAYQNRTPLIYVNLVGAQDELVFDGGSMIFDDEGKMFYRAPFFQEVLPLLQLESNSSKQKEKSIVYLDVTLAPILNSLKKFALEDSRTFLDENAQVKLLYRALMLGLASYVDKNGFKSVLIGLSGGVDSALVLTLAVDALGAENVHAVMMPSCYTSPISLEDSFLLAQNLGIDYQIISIQPLFELFKQTLGPFFLKDKISRQSYKDGHVEENLQARIRSVILMAISNKCGSLLLSTGNKSELSVGYCTLYGDMSGAFAPIKDVDKSTVYKLCQYRNGSKISPINPIPLRILNRAPSAELKFNQCDQDFLPPYDILDGLIEGLVVENYSLDKIKSMGFTEDQVNQVSKLIRLSEYKRRQAPIGTKVTKRAFGRDWRFPLTSKFIAENSR